MNKPLEWLESVVGDIEGRVLREWGLSMCANSDDDDPRMLTASGMSSWKLEVYKWYVVLRCDDPKVEIHLPIHGASIGLRDGG